MQLLKEIFTNETLGLELRLPLARFVEEIDRVADYAAGHGDCPREICADFTVDHCGLRLAAWLCSVVRWQAAGLSPSAEKQSIVLGSRPVRVLHPEPFGLGACLAWAGAGLWICR